MTEEQPPKEKTLVERLRHNAKVARQASINFGSPNRFDRLAKTCEEAADALVKAQLPNG